MLEPKLKGKALRLPEREQDDKPLATDENARQAQDLARRVSHLALGLLEAKVDG